VRESILWDNVVMESGSRAQFSIVLEGLRVTSGESFSNTVIVDEAEAEDASLMASDHVFHGITSLTPSLLLGQKRPWYLFLKRFMDIVISAIVFVTMLPVLLIIALAVKLDSTGPVLFRQKRSGKGGNDFRMLKFRTMVQDAENQQEKLLARKDTDGPMFKLAVDPRTTRVGAFLRRTSLDELPQLINVLIGEMSLVGPRPLVMDEMKCSPSWREIRLRVKPGMTGLWQVSGRSEGHFHDWIRHDIHYVMNQSLWLDLKILFRTVKVVLKKVGAY
jgi:exopolysaccharide biosynthesis polyprenyl glycosylphosphotransferase